MSRFATLALLAALFAPVGFLASTVGAQDNGPGADKDGPRHRRAGKPGERNGGQLRERIMGELFKGITLDATQKDALKKIHEENRDKREDFAKEHKQELKAFRESMDQWHEAHKEDFKTLRAKLESAREAKDKDAGEKARAEMKALIDSRPKMPEALKAGMFDPAKAEAQIRTILHPDQVAKFDENVKALKEKREKGPDGCKDCKDGKKDGDRKEGRKHRERKNDGK